MSLSFLFLFLNGFQFSLLSFWIAFCVFFPRSRHRFLPMKTEALEL